MALLESCTGLSKSFGSRVLFSGIALGISEGERLGLIGPNGAGKSTLLKILAGKLDSDEGSVSLRRNTRVGYVPQQTEFPERKTVTEIIGDAIAGERLEDAESASRINLTLGRAASPSRARWRSIRTYYFSMSPPTTWISKASSGSKNC
jgi:ATP-binding cassette subfamily F protein uup